MPLILRSKSIPIRHANRVIIRPAILSIVGTVRLVPRLGVQRAVSALGDIVNRENIGVEEVAGAVTAVGFGVAMVIRRVGLAGCRALEDVVRPGEVLDAHVGAGSVDGAAELDGAGEVGLGWGRRVLDVA